MEIDMEIDKLASPYFAGAPLWMHGAKRPVPDSRDRKLVLNVGGNQRLLATYIDQSQNSVAVTAAALVDPLGVVFDSATGLPVNGAQVTLINVATGLPASVLGNDGVSSYPATVTSGGSARSLPTTSSSTAPSG